MLRVTPFHPRTAPLNVGQQWRRWAGYLAASAYELAHDREYHAIRSAAALFDVSPLYKYHVSGPDAARLLDRIVTRDVQKMSVGQVFYTTWCDSAGKVIDDGTVSRLEENHFRMTAADPNLRWLETNAVGMKVTIEDVSDALAALSIQGPNSRVVLEQAMQQSLSGLKFFRLTQGSIRGVPVTITRTGYTGDLGYEVWIDPTQAVQVWDTLIEVGNPFGIMPAGMLALDIARIEAGLLLIDVDYVSAHKAIIPHQLSSPYELGLGWTVSEKKGPFNGRRALRAERARAAEWTFAGLEIDWPSLEAIYAGFGLPPSLPTAAWRVSVPIYHGGDQVGYATSGCWSPLLKKYIALAHLQGAHGKEGSEVTMEVTVEHRRRRANARVTKTPFFNPDRKRA
jgi:aminomethyltransferase